MLPKLPPETMEMFNLDNILANLESDEYSYDDIADLILHSDLVPVKSSHVQYIVLYPIDLINHFREEHSKIADLLKNAFNKNDIASDDLLFFQV